MRECDQCYKQIADNEATYDVVKRGRVDKNIAWVDHVCYTCYPYKKELEESA